MNKNSNLPTAFFQVMTGLGYPSAWQWMVASCPEAILESDGSTVHFGGTKYYLNKGFLIFYITKACIIYLRMVVSEKIFLM